jgi:hypothetical protein
MKEVDVLLLLFKREAASQKSSRHRNLGSEQTCSLQVVQPLVQLEDRPIDGIGSNLHLDMPQALFGACFLFPLLCVPVYIYIYIYIVIPRIGLSLYPLF